MKKILIVLLIVLTLLAVPIRANEVCEQPLSYVIDNLFNQIRRMTKTELVILEERVGTEILRNAATLIALYNSLQAVATEANNIIIERQDNAQASVVQR